MAEIELVLTDIDGTVVPLGGHVVSERVRDAVIACEDQGVTVAAVTGRPYEMAKGVLEVLGFEDLCIFDGGASIRNPLNGELVWSKWLEPEVLREISAVVLPHCAVIDYSTGHNETRPDEADIDSITEAAPYVFAAVPPESLPEISHGIARISDIVMHVHPGFGDFLHLAHIQINHVEADKYHGVQALLDITGVSKEAVLGIGDSSNDSPLFRNAGLKVAMGNATDALKAEADHVVSTVDEDGFAEAMERFVLKSKVRSAADSS